MPRAAKRPRAAETRQDGDTQLANAIADIQYEMAAVSEEGVEATLMQLEERWGIDLDNLDTMGGLQRVENVFKAVQTNLTQSDDCGALDGTDVVRKGTIAMHQVAIFRVRLKELTVLDQYAERVNRLYECAHYCCMGAVMFNRAAVACHPHYDSRVSNEDTSLLRFCGPPVLEDDSKELSALHQLVLYLLEIIRGRGYKRCGDMCYQMIITKDGHLTQAWKEACSIRDLAYRETSQDINMMQMRNALSRGDVISNVVLHLSEMYDWRFPDLMKDRRLIAFQNGLYITDKAGEQDAFVPYTIADPQMQEFKGLAACKYFDMDFPVEEMSKPWPEIETPALQSILTTQGFGPVGTENWENTKWIYNMLGRLLYKTGSLDNYQVALFFKGVGDSGKSTIIKSVISRFYDIVNVGILENNAEKQWCIGNLADKFLFVAPEVKRDFRLCQADFQKLTAGEAMACARKFKNPLNLPAWSVPGVYAGNELPGWIDNAGSVSRRLFVVEFKTVVKDKDTTLDAKLEKEMPAIILKVNRAYREAVHTVGSRDLWRVVPEYFNESRNRVASNCNPLEDFITSGKLELAEDAYMSWGDFTDAFHEHEVQNSLKRTKLAPDVYDPIFARHKMARVPMSARPYQGTTVRAIWVQGCLMPTDATIVDF